MSFSPIFVLVLWISTYCCLVLGLIGLGPLWHKFKWFLLENRAVLELRSSIHHLKLIEEMLESGQVPDQPVWDKIKFFPKPWAEVLSRSLSELRDQGAPVRPTLLRIRETLEAQVEFILDAKTKSSQAFSQAFLGLFLVPAFSLVLYFMLPGIQNSTKGFLMLSFFCFLLALTAFLWMFSMVESARFGDLRAENRHWLVSVHATLERILALISIGDPPDVAWKKAMGELSKIDPGLVSSWKLQVWDPDFRVSPQIENQSERLVLGLGQELRKSIQTSLVEGRPCVDRIESVHRAFQVDLHSLISRQLSLLPHRCLKPLFIFVLPSILILMLGSFAISFQEYLS